jgi:hypothetical protein
VHAIKSGARVQPKAPNGRQLHLARACGRLPQPQKEEAVVWSALLKIAPEALPPVK